MRISRKTEYGLRALFAMVQAPEGQWVAIQELSEQQRIPVKFLEQILLTLRHEGLLMSKRGVGGGYSLRPTARTVSVGEVIRKLEGTLAPLPCAGDAPESACSCPDPSRCALRLIMLRVRHQVSALLDSLTLEQAAREGMDGGMLHFDI